MAASSPPGADAGSVMHSIGDTSPRAPVALPEIDVPVDKDVKLPDGVTVTVREFKFTGNTAFDSETLAAIVDSAVGNQMALPDLLAEVRKITRHYRANGYVVARAYLPAQEVSNGLITIGVLEGTVGNVSVDGEPKLPGYVTGGYVDSLRSSGVLRAGELERPILLLNDLPGVSARATLSPGDATGSTDVEIVTEKTPVVTGSIDLNNYGSEYNGEWRLGGQVNANNALGFGELITVRPVISEGLDTFYGQIGGVIPVGKYGTKVGLFYTHVDSDVGKEFAVLGLEGETDVFSIDVTHPFVRTRDVSMYGYARFDAKETTDSFDSQLALADNTDYLKILTVGLSGETRDGHYGGGTTAYSVSISKGFEDVDKTSTDPLADGQFARLNWDVSRLQRLGDFNDHLEDTLLFVRMTGQAATQRMVSSEQISLGGPRAVRAFRAGEAQGDAGLILTAEVRQKFHTEFAAKYVDHVQGYLGVDLGFSSRNDPLPGEEDEAVRSGVAVGMKVGKTRNFMVDLGFAADLFGDGNTARGGDAQLLLQAVKWYE